MASTGVVITGFGVISPLGLTAGEMWQGLSAGRCGIGPITAFDPVGFPCKLAGQVPDFRIQQFVPKALRKSTKLMSRDIQLAVVAAHEAVGSSGLITKAIDPDNVSIDPARAAINLGAGLISCDLEEIALAVAASTVNGRFNIQKWGKDGLDMITPLWLLKYLPNMLACHVGIIHDIQGPSNTITCAETSATLAISEAAQVIARGHSDIAIAGGAEAKVNPMVMLRQCLLKRAAADTGQAPAGACRPFDVRACGSIFGEGAAILVLEDKDHAANRRADIHAELAGIGQGISINPACEHLEPDGAGLRIAIEKALADAGIQPQELDLIIPHGTAVPADDLAEAKAIEALLGDAVVDVPVWPTKSMLSNTGAAGGAMDIIAAVCAMKNGLVPAAKNCEQKAPGCNLNIPQKPIKKSIKYALCCSYTPGGQTAAVVLKNPGVRQAG